MGNLDWDRFFQPRAYVPICVMGVGTLTAQSMATTPDPPLWVAVTAALVFTATYVYALITLPLIFFRYLKELERRDD